VGLQFEPDHLRHPVFANGKLGVRLQIGRFCRDFRPFNLRFLSLWAFAHLATNFGALSLHSKIPFLAAGPECENDGICVLNRSSFAQAIRTAIDDYAELETGNREYFWNRPHSIG
jgi:hypothetical protein